MTVNDDEVADLLYRMVGENVREYRDNDLTQQELADEVGIGRTSITNLERGKQRVPLHHLLRIAHVLEVELSDLVPTWDDLKRELALEDRPETQRFVDDILEGRE